MATPHGSPLFPLVASYDTQGTAVGVFFLTKREAPPQGTNCQFNNLNTSYIFNYNYYSGILNGNKINLSIINHCASEISHL
jgi:hypothetical protein